MLPNLSDRLRGIVRSPVPRVDPASLGPASPNANVALSAEQAGRRRVSLDETARVLGGTVDRRDEGAVVTIEQFYHADQLHGRQRIGAVVQTLSDGRDALDVLERAWPTKMRPGDGVASWFSPAEGGLPPPTGSLLFLDVETTGLAGGAGTQAFLVGCARLDSDGIRVRQFLLPGFEHERALLGAVAEWTAGGQALVTFNGRSFDLPLIETRFLFHRLEFPLGGARHLDMLHPARRLWKERPMIAGPPLDDESCRLSVLERHLAGVHRVGDVAGFEIPSRFFRFVREGDAQPLTAVLEHNRIDLISLALVTARAIEVIEQGPSATQHARECLGLGRLYERAGRRDEAESCFAEAAARAARIGREPAVRAEALRRLALTRRRARRTTEAAHAWAELVTMPGCPASLRREAREALAIHHEHRSKDLSTARAFALDLLQEVTPAAQQRVRYRLARLNRKLNEREDNRLID